MVSYILLNVLKLMRGDRNEGRLVEGPALQQDIDRRHCDGMIDSNIQGLPLDQPGATLVPRLSLGPWRELPEAGLSGAFVESGYEAEAFLPTVSACVGKADPAVAFLDVLIPGRRSAFPRGGIPDEIWQRLQRLKVMLDNVMIAAGGVHHERSLGSPIDYAANRTRPQGWKYPGQSPCVQS